METFQQPKVTGYRQLNEQEAAAMNEIKQKGVEIDRKQIQLDEPLRTAGTHLVPVKLHASVEFPVTVEVGAG